MKKLLLILAAMTMSASCLVSCGDNDENEEGSQIVFPNDGSTKLHLNDTTRINSISQISGVKGHVVVTAKTSKVLLQKEIESILTYIEPIDIDLAFGSHFEIPSQEGSVLFSRIIIYPYSLANINIKEEGIDSLDLYLEGDEIDGLDLTFKYIGDDRDDAIVKDCTYEGKALHLKLDRYAKMYAYLNGKFEVVSTETVAIEAKPEENGTLKCKWGIEKPTELCDNGLIASALENYFGTSVMTEDVKVSDVNASYQQEVVTLKLISGSKTFNLKIYGKPFKIDN